MVAGVVEMNVGVQCVNTYNIQVEITATAPLGEWEQIAKLIREAKPGYYGPLSDFLNAIDRAARSVSARETIKAEVPA
jgi:hypothetical protein